MSPELTLDLVRVDYRQRLREAQRKARRLERRQRKVTRRIDRARATTRRQAREQELDPTTQLLILGYWRQM